MEIEAKYRLIGETAAEEFDAIDLSPYRLQPDQELSLDDTIFDTPDRVITSAGHALRVRHEGAHTLLTLKGPGTVEGAVHRREELESELFGPQRDRAGWPPEIREAVFALVGESELTPLARVQNQRRTWLVLSDTTTIAELALDRGVVAAGGREEAFHELELELKGDGQESDLAALDLRLRAALQLESEPRSKLARALALLRESDSGDDPTAGRSAEATPVSLDPPQLTPPAWRPGSSFSSA